MPKQKVTNALDTKIESIISTYQNYRKTFEKFAAENFWAKQTATPLSSDQEKRNEKLILILATSLNKLVNDCASISKHLDVTNPLHNDCILTLQKLLILTTKLPTTNLPGSDKKARLFLTTDVLIALDHHMTNGTIKYNHDIQFQQDIFYSLQVLYKEAEKQNRDESFIRMRDAYDLPYKLDLPAFSFKFARACPDNIIKLKLLADYYRSLIVKDALTKADKLEFNDAHRKTTARLKEQLVTDPSNIEAAVAYGEAQYLALLFRIKTHHRFYPQENTDAPYSLEDKKAYFQFIKTNFETYIKSSIEKLTKADPAKLKQDPELFRYFAALINQLQKTNQEQLEIINKRLKPEENSHDFIRDVDLFMQDVMRCQDKVLSIVKRCLPDAAPSVKEKNLKAEIANMGAIVINKLIMAINQDDFNQATQQANQAADFLVEWEEKEKRHFENIQSTLKKHEKRQAKNPPEKPAQIPDNAVRHFTREQYLSRNLHQPHKADETHKHVDDEAFQSNNSYQYLLTLDGQLFTRGKRLIKKTKMLRSMLTADIRDLKNIPDERQTEFAKLSAEVTKELQAISELHEQYDAIEDQSATEANSVIKEDLGISRTLIGELINQLKVDNDNIQMLLDQLQAQLKRRRANIIRRLGRQTIKDIKNQTFTDAEIDKIGEDIFKEIGEKKKRDGKKLSNFTAMRKLAESLSKNFKAAGDSFSRLSERYKTSKITSGILSESLQKAFAAVPDEALMVGGNVIAYLMNDNTNQKFNAHDFDFVVPDKHEQTLITTGFQHSKYMPNLYQKNEIDVTVAKSDSPDWLMEDAKSRDFTICALYMDKNCNIEDPLGTAIDDIANKRLRMIDDPVVRLREDPTRALRAMRYIMAGYQPDQALIDALKSLEMPQEHHKQHLFAVARKHLLYLDPKKYVSLLHEYDLLEKLFGIDCKANTDLALWKLEHRLGIKKPAKAKHTHFFAHTDEQYARLSKQVASNPRLGDFASNMKDVKPERRLAMQALNL